MIKIENYNKTFHLKSGDVVALDDVSLNIKDGEKFGVIGYSGAGKSTLVRCINFLETPDSGSMTMEGFGTITAKDGKLYQDGKILSEKSLNNMRRSIGMIFQHFNLFDRSTVFDNVAYTLKFNGKSKEEISKRVFELLDLVGLADKADVFPSQLSGGQKQRVAIARALANNPKLLLSDEATSALDPDATESILRLLNDLNKKLGLTIVIITHEMSVIKTVCDRVAVMEKGKVVEEGTVYDVFSLPIMPITEKFVNSTSSLAKVDDLVKEAKANGEHLYKLIFDKNVDKPLISYMSRNFFIDFNIMLANLETIGGNGLGAMVVKIDGDQENIDKAMDYLKESNVRVEVLA